MVVGGGGIQAISDTASYEVVNKIVWLSVDVKTEISARTGHGHRLWEVEGRVDRDLRKYQYNSAFLSGNLSTVIR